MLRKYVNENREWVDREELKKPSGIPAPVGTGFLGVIFNPFTKQYQAYIYMYGKNVHIRYYETAVEAAKKRDIVARLLGYPLNFR